MIRTIDSGPHVDSRYAEVFAAAPLEVALEPAAVPVAAVPVAAVPVAPVPVAAGGLTSGLERSAP